MNSKLGSYQEKPESHKEEKLDHILEYILINYDSLINNDKAELNCDIVSFRGLLRLIMNAPYENREDFIILASRFKNTIYLCAAETERKKAERLSRTEHDKKFLKYGFIFEHFMMSGELNFQNF